jgi:CRP-like cAMP-binding protein
VVVSQANSTALESAAACNHLLAALPAGGLRRLIASVELTHCPSGTLLLDDGQPAERVFFPVTCVAARFCTLDDGVTAEQSIVGCDGFVGVSAFLGGLAMPWRVETIIGGDALGMPAEALLAEFRRGGALQRLLLRYTHELIVQVSAEATCRSHHTVDRRLARLLLQIKARWSGADLPLTQESLGMLLGARRETVCHAAAHLQDQGCIHHERGHVRILDAARLAKAACGCCRPTAAPRAHDR